MEKKKLTCVYLLPSDIERGKKLAKNNGFTLSGLFNYLLKQRLKLEDKANV